MWKGHSAGWVAETLLFAYLLTHLAFSKLALILISKTIKVCTVSSSGSLSGKFCCTSSLG